MAISLADWYNIDINRRSQIMSLKPVGLTEKIMYSTVRISTNSGTGTGYFFNFHYENTNVPVIVTNKHVVNYKKNEAVIIKFHTINPETKEIDKESFELKAELEWIFHPDHDLCCTPLVRIIDYVKENYDKTIYFQHINEEHISPIEKLQDLDAVESVLMVGYPIGLWDEKNNLPLFRQGITASHPALDFNNKGIGVIDIASFPGSSGSPIFIYNPGMYNDKTTNSINLGGRLIFLGTLYAGPMYNAKGDISIREIPTSTEPTIHTPVMINLGYYIKSSELLVLKDIIKAMLPPSE